jgi:hypothetical protein
VQLEHREVQLRHEEVHVVARVADECDALAVARHVGAAGAEEELRAVVPVEEIRTTNRSAAVDALEVDTRRAEVADCVGVGLMGDGRAVGGDVVRDELPEDRPARRLASVVALAGIGRKACVACPATPAEHAEELVLSCKRSQLRKEPAVAPGVDRRPGRAPRSEAVVADVMGRDGGHAKIVPAGARVMPCNAGPGLAYFAFEAPSK